MSYTNEPDVLAITVAQLIRELLTIKNQESLVCLAVPGDDRGPQPLKQCLLNGFTLYELVPEDDDVERDDEDTENLATELVVFNATCTDIVFDKPNGGNYYPPDGTRVLTGASFNINLGQNIDTTA